MTPTRSARSVAALLLTAVVAAGCTSAIGGQALKLGAGTGTTSSTVAPVGPNGPKAGAAPADIKVTGDAHSESDTLAKNTIADLYTYYTDIFPKDFNQPFTQAKELVSYDSNDKSAKVCGSRSLYQEVNASYNPSCDTIVWDRGVLLPQMTKDLGPLAVPTVLAHEMGHLVQARLKVPDNSTSILLEQQADCYAGAYWKWVADGNSKYYDLNTDGFRQTISAILSTGDPVGSTSTAAGAHGSAFDRSFSFSLGYNNGAVRCNKIDEAEVAGRIKETGFTVIPKNYSNIELTDKFINQIAAVVNDYFSTRMTGYKAPTLTTYDSSTAPDCTGSPSTFPTGYCAATNTVTYNLKELQRIATPTAGFASKNGDFSAVILLVSRFGLAAEATGKAAVTGNQSGLRALCYAGSWASWMRKPQGTDKLELSPNDLDKAVYEVLASPTPATDATGATSTTVIDQIQALYIGVIYDSTHCNDFYSS